MYLLCNKYTWLAELRIHTITHYFNHPIEFGTTSVLVILFLEMDPCQNVEDGYLESMPVILVLWQSVLSTCVVLVRQTLVSQLSLQASNAVKPLAWSANQSSPPEFVRRSSQLIDASTSPWSKLWNLSNANIFANYYSATNL